MVESEWLNRNGVDVKQPRVCVLGAAPDTGNLGVSALSESIIAGLHGVHPEVQVTVFDNGLGRRHGRLRTDRGDVEFERLGIRHSKRFYRYESLVNMQVAARFPVLANPSVQRLREADLVVDISGGDSFTDLYGTQRFDAMTRQKEIALRCGAPLALLPQTYGPFSQPKHRALATDLLRRSSHVWARDAASLDTVQSMLGDDFDPHKHHLGVDVAFALPVIAPRSLSDAVRSWLEGPTPVLGLNISGLLANDPTSAADFGLSEPYAPMIERLLAAVLARTESNVLLVPHVIPDEHHVESDTTASHRLRASLPVELQGRVRVLEGVTRASEVKWVIGQCDAFCGTRMHSTIAALSTKTPTVALAYSLKTAGVFETCRQGDHVSELRSDRGEAHIDKVLDLWNHRTMVRAQLAETMPAIIRKATEPFDVLAPLFGGRALATPMDGR